MLEVGNWSWNQKVAQLNLEKLCLLLKEKEGAVNRLDYDDSRLIRSKVSNHEVKGISLEAESVHFLEGGKSILVDHQRDG